MIDYIETITNDVEAEICFQNHQERLKDLKTEQETLQQVIKHYTYKLKDVIERTDKEFDNFKFKALTYFDVADIKKKETKTMIKYKLPSFEIIETKEKINPDRKYFEEHKEYYSEYVENVKKLKWGVLKKEIQIVDRQVFFDGELIEDAPVEIKEAERKIKY